MKLELRDDISRKDLLTFFMLLLFLAVWTWFIFWSGFILK